MSKDIDPEELSTNAERLRKLTSEAHAATKDLRAAIKEFKETERKVRSHFGAIGEEAMAILQTEARTILEEAVKKELSEFGPETRKAMDQSVEKIIQQFDVLMNTILNGNEGVGQNDLRVILGVPEDQILKTVRGPGFPLLRAHDATYEVDVEVPHPEGDKK